MSPWFSFAVYRPPAVAGRDAGSSGDIDVSVDVALLDTGLGQVAALGFGVHARPVRLLVPAGADVTVHRHGPSSNQTQLIRDVD